MKNYTKLRLKNFPEIDEKNILKFHKSEYTLKDQVLFTHSNLDKIGNFPLTHPNFSSHEILLQSNIEQLPTQVGPQIDMNKNTPKISPILQSKLQTNYLTTNKDIFKSLMLHGGIIFCYVILNYFSFFHSSEPEIVEVTFGLSNKLVQTEQDSTSTQPVGQTEATRTKEDLPQLPKNVSPDIGPKPSPENLMANTNKKNDFTFNESKKTISSFKKEKQESKSKQIGQKTDNIKNNIDVKDYLKRKEEDLRKIAEDKKQGVHGKNPIKPDGQKHSLSKLPKSPFQTTEDIPEAPPGLTPTGSEQGMNAANYNAYRLYLENQLRINWNMTEGAAYPKNIYAIVEFTVNKFGYLIGKPRINKSSGNKDFDELAIKSAQETFPVTTPPPKSIHPPQVFNATYRAKGVD